MCLPFIRLIIRLIRSRRAPQVLMMKSTNARTLTTLPWLGPCTVRSSVSL